MNYVIGDIQGCYKGLRSLLKKVNFCVNTDSLWAVGDLVARGEDSLSTLAFLYDLGPRFKTVLGNHDLHLLSVINGIKPAKEKDNLIPLLKNPNINVYHDWLREFPLALKINEHTLIAHAGLYPSWSLENAVRFSLEVENKLKSSEYFNFLTNMYNSDNDSWTSAKRNERRVEFITNAFTRMRYLGKHEQLNFTEKRSPSEVSKNLIPWYEINNCKLLSHQRIIFGHWASLKGRTQQTNKIGLDMGYVWGGKMSCLCIETNTITHVNN